MKPPLREAAAAAGRIAEAERDLKRERWDAIYARLREKIGEAIPGDTPCAVVILVRSEDGLEMNVKGACVHEALDVCKDAVDFFQKKVREAEAHEKHARRRVQ